MQTDMDNSATIIIAEDNPRDLDYLSNNLQGQHVIRTVNGHEALAAALNFDEPHVISDIQMPEMNGVDFARELWQQRPMARIVFWSQYQDELYVRSLARLIPPDTVYGYVLKYNSADVIRKAIVAVFSDSQCWIDPKVRNIQARVQRPDSSLSDAEYDVLIDIALGLTDNAIARRRYLSRRGVQNRLRSLYTKLGVEHIHTPHYSITDTVNMRTRAVSIALRRGLVNNTVLEEEEKLLEAWLVHQNQL